MALTVSADAPFHIESVGIDLTTIEYEQQLRAEAAEQRRLEMRQRAARGAAHAKMPSTMYASTPSDPSEVPHVMPGGASELDDIVALVMPRYLESVLEAESKPLSQRWQRVLRTIESVEQSRGRRDDSLEWLRPQHPETLSFSAPVRGSFRGGDRLVVPYFPSAADPSDRQGLVRVINRTSREGVVTIEAMDGAGTIYEPITFSIEAESALHFNSEDLERGNAGIGLHSGTGPGQGAWVLSLSSTVAIEADGYIQTPDGYVTAILDTASRVDDDSIVTYLSPTNDANRRELLRLVNLNAEPVEVLISSSGEFDTTSSSVTIELPAHRARTYFIRELTTGEALRVSGSLARPEGTWQRLAIEAIPGVLAMSFSTNDAGHLTNLSSLRPEIGLQSVPLFMSASDPYGRQGLIRVVNRESHPAILRMRAFDDAGRGYEPVTLSLDTNELVEIDSNDLELGNPAKGLPSGTGSGQGNWRLEFSSESDVMVLPFVKTTDGLLTPMHDTVSSADNRYEIAWFKAVDDSKQVGLLRLINSSAQPVNVSIRGMDDLGKQQGTVKLTVAPQASRALTVMELESGAEDLIGMLGDGFGEWRLTVSADAHIDVMNLVSTPTGHLTNLSTSAMRASSEDETAESVFESSISPIVQNQCINCHVQGGASQNTRLVFVGDDDDDHLTKNMGAFQALLDEVENGAEYVLNKIQGVGHGGGVQVRAGTDNFTAMERFLELLGEEVEEGPTVTPETLFEGVVMESDRQTLRRAAIVFAGRVPTDKEYAMLVDDDEMSLRTAIRGLMQGPGFHEFLIRASNDRLFTDRDFRTLDDDGDGFVEFPRRLYSERQKGQEAYSKYLAEAQYGFRRAPLELIAYVVENDLPYTEILTADYVMANPMAAVAYGASTEFENKDDPNEFLPSSIDSYYRPCEGYQVEREDLGYVVVNTGPCATEYPHAGILNSKVFLQRYPTTATNRNRARSRWTYYHFLGLDIEKSASRTTDPVALADTDNPTLGNPACTVCHAVLDPVAGAFQNYGDEGFYRDQWGGMDALDRFYKYEPTGRNDISVVERSKEDSVVSLGTVQLFADRENELGLKNLRTFEGDTKLHIGLGEVTLKDENGAVGHRFEVSDVAKEEDCGEVVDEGYILWDCSELFVLALAPLTSGTFEIEVEAWVFEEGTKAATLQVWMPGPFYRRGDTWYRDMREPGFGEQTPTEAHNSTQWLAQHIVEDERFVEATVKFWWPAIMGSETLEPPENVEDVNYEATLLASSAQSEEVQRLANGFRVGFNDGDAFNLRDLLVEITLSPWFRTVSVEIDDTLRELALSSAGARRLLTPEELAHKTLHLTGFQWGRYRDRGQFRPEKHVLSALTDPEDGYGLLLGGIDSDGITERARDLTSTMAGVAQSHASESSCPIVMRELFLLPDDERLLFEGFDRVITPTWEFGETFEVKGASREEISSFTTHGTLRPGEVTIKLAYLNDYWDGPDADRNVLLDRLRVLRGDQVVFTLEMEDHEHEHECHHIEQEAFHLSSGGTSCVLAIPVTITAEATYTVELTAWGDQAGDEAPRLNVSVESDVTNSAGSLAIRTKLADLYEKLHGVNDGTDSAEVQGAYSLFVDVWEANLARESPSTDFREWQDIECDWASDQYFLDGILKDAWVFREDWGDGREARHDWDWEHIGSYFNTVDFSDSQSVARTWVVVMAYLLMDYRYLYL